MALRWLLAALLLLTPARAVTRLYVAPDDGVGYLKAFLGAAQQHVEVALYLWTRGRLDLAETLAKSARRGVRVRVLLDERPGGEPQDPEVLRVLRDAGVEVRLVSPVRFANYHIKAAQVDGKKLWFSTGNWALSSFTRNREYSVVTDRPEWVGEFGRVFDADWEGRAVPLAEAHLVWSPERVYSLLRPFWEGNARHRLEELIAGARKDILIEQNGFTDEGIYQALLAAMDRGVRVRLLGDVRARRSGYFGRLAERLRRQGAEVRYLRGLKVHAKAMLIDGQRAFVGSQNFTATALTTNRELGAVLGPGPALDRLRAQMEADWKRAAPAVAPPQEPVPWQEAGRYLGLSITIFGRVLGTERRGSVYRLRFDPKGRFFVIVPARVAGRFPLARYPGHVVRVHGRVRRYREHLEIVVEDPRAIEVVR